MIERVQLFEFPILLGAHFAKVFPKLHEADVALRFFGLFSGQDFVDLAQNEDGTARVDLW